MVDAGSPVRIAIVTGADLRRGAPGGTRSYVVGLTRFLVQQKVHVDIISNGPVDDVPVGVGGFSVTPGYRPSTLRFQRALRKSGFAPGQGGPSLIHFQRPDDLWPLRRVRNLPPSVCTLHGDPSRGVRRRKGRMAAALYRSIERRVMLRFGSIIAVDKRTAETYRSRYPSVADRVVQIPVGVEGRWGSGPRLRPTKPDTTRTFLFAGRLSVEKRVDRIIDFFLDGGPLSCDRLLIAGDGPEAVHLRLRAQGANVEFLGRIPSAKMEDLYQSSDALILASEFEGLPTVMLESLAQGCPVVAVSSSMVGSENIATGVVSVSDLSQIPSALDALTVGQANNTLVDLPSEYRWENVGARILQVYRGILGEAIP